MALLALAALGWMAVRAVRSRRWGSEAAQRLSYRRDAVIGTFLAVGWIGMWGLYFAYDWTVRMAGGAGGGVHVIRFYLPALGLITLLAAWLLVQLPRWLTAVVLVALIGLGAWSYTDLASGGIGGPGGGGTPGIGGPGGAPGFNGNGGAPPPGGGAPGGVRPSGAPPAR